MGIAQPRSSRGWLRCADSARRPTEPSRQNLGSPCWRCLDVYLVRRRHTGGSDVKGATDDTVVFVREEDRVYDVVGGSRQLSARTGTGATLTIEASAELQLDLCVLIAKYCRLLSAAG